MKLYLLIAIMFTFSYVSAQQKDSNHVISKDTIKIRGYVYYDNGRPAYGTQLTSANKELQYDRFALTTLTDSTGYFELKGAKVEDTIAVRAPFNRGKYFNRGARYMIITLPTPLPSRLEHVKLLSISAPRVVSSTKQQFSIKQYKAPKNEIFESTEVLPEYPGGIERFYSYVRSKLLYPQQAIKANIEGQVEVFFIITKTGTISHVKLVRGLGYGLDEIVIQILKQCRKWNPGKFFGRDIEANYTVSIDFKLTDK
jgi:TonB family protein